MDTYKVSGPVLFIFHVSTQFSHKLCDISIIIIPVFQMREPKHKRSKPFVHHHKLVSGSQDLNPSHLTAKPKAALTDDYTLAGFQQHKWIPSQVWRPNAPNQDLRKAVPFAGSRGECFSLLPASGGSRPFLAWGCITPISASIFRWPSPFSWCISPL